MIDFHSHILPCIDDGSSSVDESLALLEMLKEQGIDTVFATPHFDALREDPLAFINKRAKAYERLEGLLPEGSPKLLLGAEVMYFLGISRVKDLSQLCIDGTKLLLLEMPMEKWSDYIIQELIDLSCDGNITVMLAHVERYISYQKPNVFEKLCDVGIMMQVNASFFIKRTTRRKALKLLYEGDIFAIGSDCHSLKTRPPQIGEAITIIEEKFGNEFVNDLIKSQIFFLEENSI